MAGSERSAHDLLNDRQADLFVCFHPLLTAPVVRALERAGSETPMITLVTDLATGHAAWFHPVNARYLVATKQARERALACRLPTDAVQVTSPPVPPCFVRAARRDVAVTRKRPGLDAQIRVVLLLSGTDGIAALQSPLKAVMASNTHAQMVAIARRDKRLRTGLASGKRFRPLRVEGFVDNVHGSTRAATRPVTKAGLATITEALVVGTRIVLSGAVPGQEPPNVEYVTETGTAV